MAIKDTIHALTKKKDVAIENYEVNIDKIAAQLDRRENIWINNV